MLRAQRVIVLTKDGELPGVVERAKQKVRKGADPQLTALDDLHIDIGAKDGDEARMLVRPGDAVVIAGEPVELPNGRVASRSLDNRLGAFVALEAARLVAEAGGAPGEVAAVAAVQEEVGDFGGARVATFALEPAIAIAVDVTHSTDVPGGDPKVEGEHGLGSGPAISRGSTINPKLYDLLAETAEAEGIELHDRGLRRNDEHGHGRDVPLARRRRDGARLDPAPLHAHADRDRRPRGRRAVRPPARGLRPAARAGRQLHPLTLG